MAKVGELLRDLMRKRSISGVDLAAQIEISPTALSQILNGISMPRQSTFGKLMKRLCETPEERSALLDSYVESGGRFIREEPEPSELKAEPLPEEEAASYLEAKSVSIAFETDIKHLLDEARIPHIPQFNIPGKLAVDFVTKGKTKIAIECKSNLTKGWERLLGTCLLVKRNLPADAMVVVVPYHNPVSRAYEPDFLAHGITLEVPATLIERLKKLGA